MFNVQPIRSIFFAATYNLQSLQKPIAHEKCAFFFRTDRRACIKYTILLANHSGLLRIQVDKV